VQWIDICDGNMQEGSFRCDVNVSVRPKGSEKLGTRREIKNLNSFKFMQQAIEYETRWQIETLEDGGKIQQATVLFNPDTGETKSMRSKEEANDYRYFPDPDLLPLEVTAADKARLQATMPELPEAMKARFEAEYGLSSYDAATLTASREVADYFVEAVKNGAEAKPAANWILGALTAKLNAEDKTMLQSPISARLLAILLGRVADNTISNNAAKQVFEAMWAGENAGDVDAIIAAKGLKQESDSGAIEAIIDEVLKANPAMVEEFKAGKEKAFNALVGQVMKASKGKANPAQVNHILKNKL
jgi:aspartyl-tRNA(Asn)/glutamyl-tRNA(Gln) amidotransferase subunit B